MLSGIRKLCHRIFTKIITKKLQKNYCKNPSKELQYGYRKGEALLDHEIFFFLFFGISGVCHPPPAVLLHSCRPTPHRRYSASCAKEPVWFRTGFFASKNPEKSTHSEGKYDLRSICLFFCKGHLQSLARRGFVFRLALWYSIYNQFIGCKHESD